MDRMTTGIKSAMRRASSGTQELVGTSPPSKAAGFAGCALDVPPPTDLAELPLLPVEDALPVELLLLEPDANAAAVDPAAALPPPPFAPDDADPPGALPIGGSGGGAEPAPRLPAKVGLLQLLAFSCCAG
jgi:hypothetical protein